MEKVLQLALKVNNSERTLLKKAAGISRFSYNWGLHTWKQRYQQGLKTDAIKLHKELNKLKKTDFPWMYEVSKCSPQEALRDLEKAFINFFEKRAGYPRYKKKGKSRDAFRLTGVIKFVKATPQSYGKRKRSSRAKKNLKKSKIKHPPKEQWYIQLPRLGRLRLHEKPQFPYCNPDELHMGMVTISRRAQRWSVSVTYDINNNENTTANSTVGLDAGLIHTLVSSDGQFIQNPRIFNRKAKKLRRLNKSLSRKERGSANYQKTLDKLSKHHAHIYHSRKDFLHPHTTSLAKNHGRLVIEDLCVRGMIRNKKLSKSIADASWGEIRRQLSYKCKWYGSELVVADRYYPSTRLCSNCQVLNPKQPLINRKFSCISCRLLLDRDLNAAYNLKIYSADWRRKIIYTVPESTP